MQLTLGYNCTTARYEYKESVRDRELQYTQVSWAVKRWLLFARILTLTLRVCALVAGKAYDECM